MYIITFGHFSLYIQIVNPTNLKILAPKKWILIRVLNALLKKHVCRQQKNVHANLHFLILGPYVPLIPPDESTPFVKLITIKHYNLFLQRICCVYTVKDLNCFFVTNFNYKEKKKRKLLISPCSLLCILYSTRCCTIIKIYIFLSSQDTKIISLVLNI